MLDVIKDKDMMNAPEFLTATQAAAYLGVTRQRVHLLTKEGYGQRVGSMWLFTRAELDRWQATPRHAGGRPKGSTRTRRAADPMKP